MGKGVKLALRRDDGLIKRVRDDAPCAPERFLDFFLILQLQIARAEHALGRLYGADDPRPDAVSHSERRSRR